MQEQNGPIDSGLRRLKNNEDGNPVGAAPEMSLGGRHEPRFSERIVVEIADWQKQTVSEQTYTENVSGHGARITSRWHWGQDDILLVALPSREMRALARAVYCEALPGDVYALGVHLLHPATEWWKEGM